jgi:hypothetical protein
MNVKHIFLFAGVLSFRILFAESPVRVVAVTGDVRVRRGLEESWSPSGAGAELKALDTIFCGEASQAVLALEDGTRFTLGGNALLDVSDLRRITERQLFLFLMSQKIGRITESDSSSVLHITSVSVVRGTQKQIPAGGPSPAADPTLRIREKNGARTLFEAGLVPNAIIKYYRILQRYPSADDRGDIQFNLGRAFEAIHETGRALEAYQEARERLNSGPGTAPQTAERGALIEAALRRLKPGT